MSATSSIEWTATVHPDGTVTPGKTWNTVRGCSIVSPGCVNCYAMKQAHRFSGPGKPYEGLTKLTKAGPKWTGDIRTVDDALLEPLKWRKPVRVFVNSMSDLFHEDVPDEFIDRVFAVMALAPQHTFQILTKRAERMRKYMTTGNRRERVELAVEQIRPSRPPRHWYHVSDASLTMSVWPLPNVWLGTSVENQHFADERIPLLLQTPAAVRFISAEPLLGPITFNYGWLQGCDACCNGDRCPGPPECTRFDRRSCPVCKGTARGINLDWVIVGGESGPGARPCDLAWARSIVTQCKAAGVSVFYKQGGTSNRCPHDSKGGCFECAPVDLRIREFPNAHV